MATQADIFAVRLKIRDPGEVIAFIAVSTLPTTYAAQTAYLLSTDSRYYVSGVAVSLKVSDATLSSLIDSYGVNGAVTRAITLIIASLIESMAIAKFSTGTESIDYQTLSNAVNFYKAIKLLYEEEDDKETGNSTGRFVRTCKPVIGGVREWDR